MNIWPSRQFLHEQILYNFQALKLVFRDVQTGNDIKYLIKRREGEKNLVKRFYLVTGRSLEISIMSTMMITKTRR